MTRERGVLGFQSVARTKTKTQHTHLWVGGYESANGAAPRVISGVYFVYLFCKREALQPRLASLLAAIEHQLRIVSSRFPFQLCQPLFPLAVGLGLARKQP